MTEPEGARGAADWADGRRDAARIHVERLARAKAAETARARELIADFVARAVERAVATGPLLARSGGGGTTCRTGLTGWYLTRDGSIGVTPRGDYYGLAVPLGLRERLRGITLQPTDPPLQVGAGARDGESIALDVLLAMRLAAGDHWPIHGR